MSVSDLTNVDRFHRFVLLAVIDLRARDDVPVHSFDVTGVCEDLLEEFDAIEELFPGGVTRNRVISALSDLEDEGHLGKETKQSATGKGRPAYTLAIDESAILEELDDDDHFAGAVDHVRQKRD